MTKLHTARNQRASAAPGDRYKWVALANTTASTFMSLLDGLYICNGKPTIGTTSITCTC